MNDSQRAPIVRVRRATLAFLSLISALSALAASWPSSALAADLGSTGAQSLLIDPSVRASGMGRASSAVFWGTEPNAWSNPALLPYNRGVRYEWSRTQLVPDLAKDVYFTSKRVTAAIGGVGFQIAGRPFGGLGGQRLDYGLAIATDADGNPVASYRSFEAIESFAAAVSGLESAEHLLRALGRNAPALSRFGDVSVGWAEKKTYVDLSPALVTLDGLAAQGSTTTHDSGVLVRLTPYNSIDDAGWLPDIDRLASLRFDVTHGRSTLNYDDATIAYFGQADPVLRTHRTGWAVHAALGLAETSRDALRRHGLGWLPAWISPLVQWGKAWDREVPMILDPSIGGHVTGSTIKDDGWEITFANIYSLRRGRIDDPNGSIIGTTSGWSLGFRLKDIAGFSYDKATVPQSIFLGPVHRKAISFFVDPFRLWTALH